MKKYKNSLVLGKFYPPHNGHLYLIDTAIEHSEKVNLLVCYNDTQSIPGDIRYDTLKSIYEDNDNISIHLVDDGLLPQHENECKTLDEFYGHWVPFVRNITDDLDCVFTSENYGDDFAKYLEIEHFLVDGDRIKYPVSGTKIRTNPFDNWEFIPDEIKPLFVKRIVLMGPESVGKSTLSINLANHYNTNYVEEYGKNIFELNGNKISIDDFIPISIGRQKLENHKLKTSNKLLFCDTEDITTYIFSKMFFPSDYKSIENILLDRVYKNSNYDLYLLLKPDCDIVQDGTRQFLGERISHYESIKSELEKYDCNYIELSGNWEDRFNSSVKIINSQFNI